jgi:hypothetical protein
MAASSSNWRLSASADPTSNHLVSSASSSACDFRDEAAARMCQQVDPCTPRQRIRQCEGVGDRAAGDGWMLEGEYLVLVLGKEITDKGGMLRPEFAEGVCGVDEGSVYQHQQGLRGIVFVREPGCLGRIQEARRQCFASQPVQAFRYLAVGLLGNIPGGLPGGRHHRLYSDDAEPLQGGA